MVRCDVTWQSVLHSMVFILLYLALLHHATSAFYPTWPCSSFPLFHLLSPTPNTSHHLITFLIPPHTHHFSHSTTQTNHDCPIIEEYAGSVATQIERITLKPEEFLSGGIAGFSGKTVISKKTVLCSVCFELFFLACCMVLYGMSVTSIIYFTVISPFVTLTDAIFSHQPHVFFSIFIYVLCSPPTQLLSWLF